jgi:hypothetical protein
MGVALAMSPCFGCGRIFAYNPTHVPSIPINGVRQPICLDCVHRANPARIKNGLRPIIPHRDAYEPCDESELNFDA